MYKLSHSSIDEYTDAPISKLTSTSPRTWSKKLQSYMYKIRNFTLKKKMLYWHRIYLPTQSVVQSYTIFSCPVSFSSQMSLTANVWDVWERNERSIVSSPLVSQTKSRSLGVFRETQNAMPTAYIYIWRALSGLTSYVTLIIKSSRKYSILSQGCIVEYRFLFYRFKV